MREHGAAHPNPNPDPDPDPNPDPNPNPNPNVLNRSPEGHDDDLFMLQLAADADAWLVSNDTYSNHSGVRARLRNRLIPYMWAGFGKEKTAFTPKADKWAAFEQDRARRSN